MESPVERSQCTKRAKPAGPARADRRGLGRRPSIPPRPSRPWRFSAGRR